MMVLTVSLYKGYAMLYIRHMDSDTQPSKPSTTHVAKSRRRWLVGVGCLLFLGALGVGASLFIRNSGPIPSLIRQRTRFTLYYPTNMPQGYGIQKNTIRLDTGVVFYSLANDKRQVRVSQQTLPANPPNLDTLGGFRKIDATAGKAAVGANNSSPTAIILSNTTLITINGSPGTPQDVVASIAKSMA